MRSYTVVGLGAIGGYYGAQLHQAGHAVRFLARSDAAFTKEHGLRVDSPKGDAMLTVEVYDDARDIPPSDTIIVATKTTTNPHIAELVHQLVDASANTPSVLVMQNGLGVEAVFAEAAPASAVMGAMCFICCHKVGPGYLRHLDYGAVTVGEYTADGHPAGHTEAVESVVSDFVEAGVSASSVSDLETGRWQKLVWNMPFNGLSVVYDALTDELVRDPAIRARAASIMGEVVAAADACGRGFDPQFADRMLSNTDLMTPYLPSMKIDHDAGRPLELNAIYAEPIAQGRAAGVPMHECAALLAELRDLDAPRPSSKR
ncbi:MAG: 2-dehydropantoate 2-reductase [Actinomycetes bacterium]